MSSDGLHYAGLLFAATLLTSLAGFGGVVETAPAILKGAAVLCLVLFLASLARLLSSPVPGVNPAAPPGR